MKTIILYVNGCSYTQKMQRAVFWPKILMRSLVKDTDIKLNFYDNKKIKTDNNNLLVSDAMSGGGNDRILHTTLESIEYLKSVGKKPNLVIIQWTHPNRRFHMKENGEIIFINDNDNTNYIPKNEPQASLETIHYIYLLQEYLIKNEIDYLFFNYVKLHESIKNLNIYSLINFDKFIRFENINDFLFDGLKDYMVKQNLTIDDYGHENYDGYMFIAKNIANRLGIKLDKIL